MNIQLAFVVLVFLQLEKPYRNEIHWIMFFSYQAKSTDIHLNWAILTFKIADLPQHENIPFTCSSGIQRNPSLSGRRWKTSSTLNKPFLSDSTLQTFLSTKVKSNTYSVYHLLKMLSAFISPVYSFNIKRVYLLNGNIHRCDWLFYEKPFLRMMHAKHTLFVKIINQQDVLYETWPERDFQ